MELTNDINRRNFIKKTALLSTGFIGLSTLQPIAAQNNSSGDDTFVIGPIDGYSPQIGTLVSMLKYNRETIIRTVKD